MWILIVILIAVVLFGMVAGYFYNRNIEKKIARGEIQEAPEVVADSMKPAKKTACWPQ